MRCKLAIRLIAAVLMVVASPAALRADDGPLSLADTVATLRQDFRAAPVWRGGAIQVDAAPRPLSDPDFSWAAGYTWSHPPVGAPSPWPQPAHDFPAWTSNGTADADPNGDMIARIGPAWSPLTWSGTLNLTARPMPAALAATVDGTNPHGYLGAAINSFPYGQRYGIFAMSARLPRGNGLWPAFWLVPLDKTWPPEIDIMEAIGREPRTLHTTLHLKGASALGRDTDTGQDLSAGFHEYAVDWGPDWIRWYFDRKPIFAVPTPEQMKRPCYILANLAVGRAGQWGGAPDSDTRFPAVMQIAWIRVWQRTHYPAEPH